MPTPYAVSSDLVSAWPAKSLEVATYLDTALASKSDLAMTQNAQTGTTYSFALADASKLLTTSNASPVSVTVTKQATVTWVTGTQLRVMNLGAGVTTLVADTGVTINGNVALKQYQGGTLIRTASDVWTFLPNASAAQASATASVATSQSVTNTAFTDLATAGPAVTLTTGTKALVTVSAEISNSTAGGAAYMSIAVSGATTVAAAVATSLSYRVVTANYWILASRVYLITGLTAGSNIFTAKYSSGSGSFAASFANRYVDVIDLGS
jgi:hypothetical protein